MPRDDSTLAPSSIMVHPVGITTWFFVCVCSAFAGQTLLALFSGFAFLLLAIAYVWGRVALKRVEYRISVAKTGFFPGQQIAVTHTLHNNKPLPLIWTELLEPATLADCALPDDKYLIPNPEFTEENPSDTHRRFYTFSFIKWYGTSEFVDTWQAKKRGVLRLNEAFLRSGDGFGLYMGQRKAQASPAQQIAVYPKLTDVSINAILQDIWDSRSASWGNLEDTTLIKTVRDYTPGDPVRRINQRLLARGQGMMVNCYEVVTPDSVLFILDSASFKRHAEDFESALSILASLLTGLIERGVMAGLCVPASLYNTQSCVGPSASPEDLTRMLTMLAAASLTDPPLQPLFSTSPPESLGQIYYLCHSAKAAKALPLLDIFAPNKTRLLVFEPSEHSDTLRARMVKSLWGGNGA